MSHSAFKVDYNKALKGIFLESAEIVSDYPEDSIDLKQDIAALEEDSKYMAASDAVTSLVAQAANAAETMPPAVAEAFVGTANCIIGDASKIIGTDIPLLKNDEDGSVNEVSLENLKEWFETAGQAFGDSASALYARIAQCFSRQNDCSKRLTELVTHNKKLLEGRNGKGGVGINLPVEVCRNLVWEGSYSPTPAKHLETFTATTLSLVGVTLTYYERLAELAKAAKESVMQTKSATISSQIEYADLVSSIEQILDSYEPPLLGNVSYAKDLTSHPINDVGLVPKAPLSALLVRSLDLPPSLTDEESAEALTAVEEALTKQMECLEKTTSICVDVFKTVAELGEKIVDETVNPTEILGAQTNLVCEVRDVCKQLLTYQSNLFDRIDAVLTWVRESTLQTSERA